MRLIRDELGQEWRTDDPASLRFVNTGRLTEAPRGLKCFVLHDSRNKGDIIEIELDRLELLATAMFGEGRSSHDAGNARWTGDSYKHAIYRYTLPGSSLCAIVLIETHGGGTQGYYIQTLTAVETWEHLARKLPSEMLWNICHDLCSLYGNARYVERTKIYGEFLQGRLKKRCRNTRIWVEFLPELPVTEVGRQ